jgi:hypothetical protein
VVVWPAAKRGSHTRWRRNSRLLGTPSSCVPAGRDRVRHAHACARCAQQHACGTCVLSHGGPCARMRRRARAALHTTQRPRKSSCSVATHPRAPPSSWPQPPRALAQTP